MRKSSLWILACIWILSAAVVSRAQDRQTIASVTEIDALGDSLLRVYSLDELLSYKEFYEAERDRLEAERIKLRDKGIRDLEAFIRNHPDSRVLDKVVFRLAELYLEKAEENYQLAQERYGEQLELYDEGKIAELPEEPKKDYSRSIALYQYIIDNFPNSPLLDDAMYNIAYLTEETGQREDALALYEKFAEMFPDSRYMPEVLMRQAEYYFNPPVNQIERAIEIYKRILAFTDSPRYDEALYRLGWSYYRLNDYPKAISYFTMLADDIEEARKFDPYNRITNPALKEESVEYIGISFLDFSGVDGVADYLEKIGGREYGFDILKKMGDAYLEVKEEYDMAVEAYETILRMYPYAKDAPLIQAKIAEAYRKMGNDQKTYLARKALFQNYREGSDWWQRVDDEAARKRARDLAELAMRANINLLVQTANETGDENLYYQAVEDSREYLKYFPQDTNAVKIHWNMALILDTRLNMPKSAFDEYIQISNRYWDTKFQKDAATNAIAIAQDLATADTVEREEVMPLALSEIKEKAMQDSSELRQSLQLEPIPLSEGEIMLTQAIDNFIKLFPFDDDTPERLSQAGSIYYNKNHFVDALKYFKTLLKHFPEHPLAEYAEYLVMESYFGKLDYKSVEIVARRLRQKANNPEYAAKANQRLAEAIFLQAENLADLEKHFRAAEEYRRVAEEVPDAEFADLALFNAGLEYDRAREYGLAVEVYATLTQRFPQSQYYISALNNMALDYGELKDYTNAALTFERLAEEDPDSAKAETHLYNASVFYVKAEDWSRAIRVNKKFVDRYPNSQDADDLFYDIATYYLKLGDLDKANDIYGDYARRFPDSPRVVETHFRRGEYFESRGQIDQARQEYEQAIQKSEAFARVGKDANDFFAAEALFRLTELQFDEYSQIEFKLPPERMAEAKKRKKEMLLEIVDNYARVAAYGTLRLYESTFKIGLAYENFAETWANQDIPEAQLEKRIVAKKEINETAAQLYERALEAYKNSREVLTRISEQYRKTMSNGDSLSTSQAGQKISFADSTLQIAQRWIDRSNEKISEVIYDIAEINYSSVQQLLNAPLPPGLDKITSLEFRNQLIGKFVRPLVDEIVQAHARNLAEAEELGLDNQWVESSRSKIISTNSLIAEEYSKLAWEALRGYQDRVPAYLSTLPEDNVMALGIADEMANFIDFSNAFAKATILAYENTLETALQRGIQNYDLLHTEEALFRFVNRFSQKLDSLAAETNRHRKTFEARLRQAGEDYLEDGLFTFEDNYFSLLDAKKEVLEQGFAAVQKYQLQNEDTEDIVLALVRSNPEEYAGILGLDIYDFTLGTDETWKASVEPDSNWTDAEFDDSGWAAAVVVDSSRAFSGYPVKRIWFRWPAISAPVDSGAFRMEADSLVADSTALSAETTFADSSRPETKVAIDSTYIETAMQSSDQPPVYQVYFSKPFEVPGLPVMAQIQIVADDGYQLYVNGEFISEARFDSAQTAPQVHDFTDFLVSGKNRIALFVHDDDRTGGGIEALVFLKSLPGWAKREAEIRVQKKREQENLLFDKGILPKVN